MKVLVATTRGQGWRASDFTHLVDGELVFEGVTCDRDIDNPDGECGCGRAWVGLASGNAGTTAEVVNLDLGFDAYRGLVREALAAYRWAVDEADQMAAEIAAFLAEVATDHAAGTILERRGDTIQPRTGARR